MNLLTLLKTSIGGTNWMTAYMNFSSHFFKEPLKVPRVLGSSLTNETKKGGKVQSSPKINAVGTFFHYSVGVFFTYVYHQLRKKKMVKHDLKTGALLGFATGIFGISVWKLFVSLHPNPPKVPLKKYFINLMIAHVIFGIATTAYYNKNVQP